MLARNENSEWVVNCKPEEEGFEDSCKFMYLRYELRNLTETFKNMNKYAKLIKD